MKKKSVLAKRKEEQKDLQAWKQILCNVHEEKNELRKERDHILIFIDKMIEKIDVFLKEEGK